MQITYPLAFFHVLELIDYAIKHEILQQNPDNKDEIAVCYEDEKW